MMYFQCQINVAPSFPGIYATCNGDNAARDTDFYVDANLGCNAKSSEFSPDLKQP